MIQRLSRVAPTVAVAGTLLLQLIGPSAPLRAQTQAGYWPQGAVGALSLTFDDGMPSQLERAVPVLNRLGLKATFYVNPNYSVEWDKHAPEWRALIAQGHELSNHTDKHPCSCQNDYRHGGDYCLEKLDQTEIARAIDDAENTLSRLTSQPRSARSFAYPCYNTDVGAGANRASYVPQIARRYVAARVGMNEDNDPATADLSYVYALPADGKSVEQIIAYVDQAAQKGRWAVLVFHGIGAEWNITPEADFQRIMDHVAQNRQRIWVAPFVTVAGYIRDHSPSPYRK